MRVNVWSMETQVILRTHPFINKGIVAKSMIPIYVKIRKQITLWLYWFISFVMRFSSPSLPRANIHLWNCFIFSTVLSLSNCVTRWLNLIQFLHFNPNTKWKKLHIQNAEEFSNVILLKKKKKNKTKQNADETWFLFFNRVKLKWYSCIF